jgi:glycosyltransferase involved in cell wall biosynthesis
MAGTRPATDERRDLAARSTEDGVRVLAFVDYYVPGYRAGGPIRAVENLTLALPEVEFRVVTRNHDLSDPTPYSNVESGSWTRVGNAWVFYGSTLHLSLRGIARLLRETPHDVLYLNSIFSRLSLRVLLLRRLGWRSCVPFVIAPRGELAGSARAIRPLRKKLFLAVGRTLGIWRGAAWQAASAHEEGDVRALFPDIESDSIRLVSEVTGPLPDRSALNRRRRKKPGHLEIAWIARIAPVKNLLGALEILRSVQGSVCFDIYGAVDDQSYWRRCRDLITRLPANVVVVYRGAVEPAAVGAVLAQKDLFFLPTEGENFGHSIFEALAAGCPALVSDRTPWRGLREAGAGWDLPLTHPHEFRRVIENLVEMNPDDHERHSAAAFEYASRWISSEYAIETNREFFLSLGRPSLKSEPHSR